MLEGIPSVLEEHAEVLTRYYEKFFPAMAPLAGPCFLSTIATTVQPLQDKRTFIITGDIPAMWLRDSSAQIANYIPFATKDSRLREILEGAIALQAELICVDPYANAFNASANGHGMRDVTQRNDRVWERKYEVDSLCAPIYLAYRYWKETGYTTPFTKAFHTALRKITAVFACEQDHARSPYSFERLGDPDTDTLPDHGRGSPVVPTGMTWSGFRPSDDRCEYGYLIPANMMACAALQKASEICAALYQDSELSARCLSLSRDIDKGIHEYAIVSHRKYGDIYAYETDGMDHYSLMDDANSPSLLAMPYLEYCRAEDTLYQNTRRFILSEANPYFYHGRFASGIGSPHTRKGYVWPIAVIMQALTSQNGDEIMRCLSMLANTHAGTNRMHESFDPDAPEQYSRPWFAWADTLLATLLDRLMAIDFFPLSHGR